MSPVSWLAVSLLFTALAQIAFKAYFGKRAWPMLACAIGFFLLVPFTTYNALKGLPLVAVRVEEIVQPFSAPRAIMLE